MCVLFRTRVCCVYAKMSHCSFMRCRRRPCPVRRFHLRSGDAISVRTRTIHRRPLRRTQNTHTLNLRAAVVAARELLGLGRVRRVPCKTMPATEVSVANTHHRRDETMRCLAMCVTRRAHIFSAPATLPFAHLSGQSRRPRRCVGPRDSPAPRSRGCGSSCTTGGGE